jgi:predicted esterase
MFVLNGKKDQTVPPIFSEEFVERYKDKNILFQLYDEKHVVSKEMIQDIMSFIYEEKVVI